MKYKTLPGFTLVEILVSMALIAAVLMLGLYTYQTFVSFHLRYDDKLEVSSNLSLLKFQLERDIRQTTSLSFQETNTLYMWGREADSIIAYQQSDVGIIRISRQRQDTFRLFGIWTGHPTQGIVLRDSAGLWEIPVQPWQGSGVEQHPISNQSSLPVDISFVTGTNTDKD